ncbi:MAG: adenine deaminase C-terminal domain-containing protein [Anaerolineae bacterium]
MNLIERRIAHYDELLAAARGDVPVDTLIHGGRILNVMTGEVLPGDLAIHKGFIVRVFASDLASAERIDARGTIAIPAFIDPHVHIESSMVLPPQYAGVVAAHGTGTVLADPHEIVNVMGVDGFRLMADNANDLPIRLFLDIPTCVPSKRAAESSGADIRADDVREMAKLGGRKLGELMSYDEIVAGDPVMTDIVKAGWELGMPRDAHFPMIDALAGTFGTLNAGEKVTTAIGMIGGRLSGRAGLAFRTLVRKLREGDYPELDTYLVALGLTADHETYGPEIQIKLDHGMPLMISAHIFEMMETAPLFLEGVRRLRYKDSLGMCTDDLWPDELLEHGGMVSVMRRLVRHGIDPVDAVRFATLNNAKRLAVGGIREAAFLGALAPGMVGDVVLVADPLKAFHVQMVLHEGKVVAARGTAIVPSPPPEVPEAACHTVAVDPVTEETFEIAAPAGSGNHVRLRALKLPKPPALPFPNFVEDRVPVREGAIDTTGYAIIAVFNRYGRTEGGPVVGLIKDYALEDGALASTLAHDSHNLIVLGTNAADMATAVNAILETQGGMAAVRGGEVLAQLAFPVGGLMTADPADVIARDAKAFRKVIATLGLDPSSPILPFAIFSLPVAPGDKVTDRGLWDAKQEALVSLFVEEA